MGQRKEDSDESSQDGIIVKTAVVGLGIGMAHVAVADA